MPLRREQRWKREEARVTDSSRMIERVGVVGAGTMGSGIAQVIAQAGIPVTLVDRREDDLERGRGAIQKSLDRLVKKGTLEVSEADAIATSIALSTDSQALAGSDLVIEAIFEDL